MTKYILVISDPHAGHLVGLTPPDHQYRYSPDSTTKRRKWSYICRALWGNFSKEIEKLPKVDGVLSMGDLIDGKGKKSGGTEQTTTDMQEQCDMSVAMFKYLRETVMKKGAPIIGVYGTDYHTCTEGDEWENIIAKRAEFAKIGAHEWIDVNGCVIDIKHKVGGSTIPHGRHTASSKELMWNGIWAEDYSHPRANIILRGHVHYYTYCGNHKRMAVTCPALQGMGSKYGAKQCSGTVDWGFLVLKIEEDGRFEVEDHVITIAEQKPEVIKL